MNIEIFRAINNLAYKNNILDKVMIFFSKDVPYLFMGILVVVFMMGVVKRNSNYRKIAVNAFVFTTLNLIFSFAIGCIYYEDRPFVHNKVNLLFPHVADASFPSDHATGTMSIALATGRYNKILSLILTMLSIIVGFSRIYVGHHYPMDVIGAYLLVMFTSYVYNLLLRSKVEKLYIEVEKYILSIIRIKRVYNGN